ncbi:28S ribosomal protein S18b, mitochondrial [Chelonus insularis]|uniref:28S ribosomal protein S18b, mitochondrial n=1 Tax=Chelonus insularis TaxID=460826 RepID=UPI00158880EC|nr:28S ribosomal protein S18b, mitochondrial [Chelonus insularis]
MLFILTKLHQSLRYELLNKIAVGRQFSRGTVLFNDEENENLEQHPSEKAIDPTKDRRNPIPVETSIRYLASSAYKQTYGDEPVWKPYRRNHKGQLPPKKTRQSCVRKGFIVYGSPCPICRDEYLVLDYTNVNLLKQFISEYNGAILGYDVTNLCRRQHKRLLVAITKAKIYGLITFDVPFRAYDYSEWYKPKENLA